ncbi:Predicted DNA-binding transcriptional regulator YafY, contains an HTH and WYL domains [Nonlabens sp. Hel1_33_55]|nr:Predicted DNA-binding transcriptional regulator YafY, contains an HTH and WYL domains [Nonlabens sp. Hel1_33_55]
MAGYNQLERLERIVQLLHWKKYITKEELMDQLWERYDIEISERSLERDLKSLKEQYSLDIEYNRQHKGYFLAEDERLLSRFFKFAELSSLAKIYEEGLKNYSQFEKWIIPDDSSDLTGVSNINPIVKAMNTGLKLKFKKENFHTGVVKEYLVTPLRLKEYLNRWYLIAVADGQDYFKNFGIERMTDVNIIREPGIDTKKFEKKLERYKDIVGINYSDEYFSAPLKVVIKTYDFQYKYLQTLPLHHSQQFTLLPDESESLVTFHLQPNHEFITQLLRMNENVEVLQPTALRVIIKDKLKAALKRY